jgi:type II secretory pathway component PulF
MAGARADLYQRLSTMFESGLPLLRALERGARQTRGRLGRALRHMAQAAGEGATLAETMTAHPEAFSPLETMTVEAGETSGDLAATFRRLASYYAFRDRVRGTISAGLVYPVLVFHIAAFVIPFPPFVGGVIGLGGYLLEAAATLLLLYVPATVIWAVVRFTPETGPIRRMLDGITLRVPVLGPAVRELALSRFARAFQILYRTGSIPVATCVTRAAELSGNAVVRGWFAGGAASAREGAPVSEGFSRRAPETFRYSWLVAEESGKLEETAGRLADVAAEESERRFAAFAAWFPRVVYALVSIYLIINIFRGFAAIYGGYQQVLE